MQKLIVTGRLGSDPLQRFFPDGKAVTTFSIADDRKWKNQSGEKKKETTWFRVQVVGGQAEACNTYLHKGDLVAVDGRLIVDAATGASKLWTADDGSTRTTLEIRANWVEFLHTKGGQAADQGEPAEDLPF